MDIVLKFLFLKHFTVMHFTVNKKVMSFDTVKNKTTVQNGVTYAKSHITKLRPNYSFGSPGNGILN